MSVETAGVPSRMAHAADLQTQFLGNLNHEIRTPLTGILGMTDLLLETALDAEQKEYVVAARTCAEELLGLFNRTLEFSELAAGRVKLARREYHLPETIRGVVSAYSGAARAKGLRLVCRLAPSLPPVAVGDADRMQRLLAHLLENAIKFTEAGKIEISASARQAEEGETLHVRVRDTGIGIPPDKLAHVFDSFRQLDAGLARRYEGLGLGLSLVKALATLMDGVVRVTSEPGKGSTFTLELPLDVPALAARRPAPEERAAPAPKRREILLVEDNALTGAALSQVLRRGGYAVSRAASGPEAVRSASRIRFDLILMDLHSPGADGFDIARQIRDLPGHASTAVVAIAASGGEHSRRTCFENGLQGFLAKPFKAHELLEVVGGILH